LEAKQMSRPEDEEFTRLVDWVEGRLSEEEARAVAEEVAAAGDAARADVAWLRAFARVSEDTVIASPPSRVRDALIERFDAYAAGKQHPGLLQRLVATLTFDSTLQPAPGLRAARAQEAQRQVVYSTDAADVALILRPRASDGLLDLYGQIMPVGSVDSGAAAARRPSAGRRVLSNVSVATRRCSKPGCCLPSAYASKRSVNSSRISDGSEAMTVSSLILSNARNQATSARVALSAAATCSSTALASPSERRPSTQSTNRVNSTSCDSAIYLASKRVLLFSS